MSVKGSRGDGARVAMSVIGSEVNCAHRLLSSQSHTIYDEMGRIGAVQVSCGVGSGLQFWFVVGDVGDGSQLTKIYMWVRVGVISERVWDILHCSMVRDVILNCSIT